MQCCLNSTADIYNHKVCHPRYVFKDKLELCVYLSDTTIRWKMYVYLLHKINYNVVDFM